MTYDRIGVASTFSPTFAAVLAEADCFAGHCGGSLEVLHAAERAEDKEARFFEALGRPAPIRWLTGESSAAALLRGAGDFDLVIAGALQREDGDIPFTSGVARALLRHAPCDLLLVPRPIEDPAPPRHVVVALEPGDESAGILRRAAEVLRPERLTIAVTQTPFAAAIAASRGEPAQDVGAWLEDLCREISGRVNEVDDMMVTSNTGFALCDAVQGLEADLLIVRAEPDSGGSLPAHMDWLYQIIPTRLLVVKGAV